MPGVMAPFANDNSGQTCVSPPSTQRSTPVMKLESSDARKSGAVAISRGRPKRPNGTIVAMASFHSCGARLGKWCIARPRTDHIDANITVLQLHRPTARKCTHGSFAGTVDACSMPFK